MVMAQVVGMIARHLGASGVEDAELWITIIRCGNIAANSSAERSPPSLSIQTPQIAVMFANPRPVVTPSFRSNSAGDQSHACSFATCRPCRSRSQSMKSAGPRGRHGDARVFAADIMRTRSRRRRHPVRDEMSL